MKVDPHEHKLPVEFYGGPLDGVKTLIEPLRPNQEVVIIKCNATGNSYAFEWANRTVNFGERWVLRYLMTVGQKVGGGQ